MFNEADIKNIKEKAVLIRRSIIEMLSEAGSGHTAGALGMSDIFASLYFKVLRHDPKDPKWNKRDIIVLSNGHICPVLYASMAHAGYFPVSDLKTLRKFGSKLQGHPHREFLNSLETSSGPLGEGLSQSAGMALAMNINKAENAGRYIYCLTGDGELDEGQNWEALMLIRKYNLNNIITIIDRNNIQIDGFTEDVMPLEPLADKFKAFGFNVVLIDGNDIRAFLMAVESVKKMKDRPSVILAKTVPGKGVKEFENKYEWHGKAPNKTEAEKALKELQ